MTANPWNPNRPPAPTPIAGELITDYRARLAHERLQAIEVRQLELYEQSSSLNAPEARIRIWERLHELSLPRDPTHRLLRVVAAATDLTLEQVQEEQRLRSAAAKAAVAPPAPMLAPTLAPPPAAPPPAPAVQD
jgi:hypothetical protein